MSSWQPQDLTKCLITRRMSIKATLSSILDAMHHGTQVLAWGTLPAFTCECYRCLRPKWRVNSNLLSVERLARKKQILLSTTSQADVFHAVPICFR